ncbi:hypothetical protein [Brevundimonas sp.]|uniref:hypothetical protein n=1 Tax=Brevundimonas sp. TaxID=1871086 RepID=UPI002898F0FD|nr:hypothetical protein [Brevundimonas sp.]
MTKKVTYLGGGTIIGWSGVTATKGQRLRGGPGFLSIEAAVANGPLQKSEFMPPPGAAPEKKPSATKIQPRTAKPTLGQNERAHFAFRGDSKQHGMGYLDSLVAQMAKNGFRKPADVARLLNQQGVKTACGNKWTPRLAIFLLDQLYEAKKSRRVEKPPKVAATTTKLDGNVALTPDDIALRLSALGRVSR